MNETTVFILIIMAVFTAFIWYKIGYERGAEDFAKRALKDLTRIGDMSIAVLAAQSKKVAVLEHIIEDNDLGHLVKKAKVKFDA